MRIIPPDIIRYSLSKWQPLLNSVARFMGGCRRIANRMLLCVMACTKVLGRQVKTSGQYAQTIVLRLIKRGRHNVSSCFLSLRRIAVQALRLLLYRIDIERVLEPRRILVDDYTLRAIAVDGTGELCMIVLGRPFGERPALIDDAAARTESMWRSLDPNSKRNVVIPVICLDGIFPSIGGTRALLFPNLCPTISRQIQALRLQSPIDVRTMVAKNVVGTSVVDFRDDSIIIIGNSSALAAEIEVLCSRLHLPVADGASLGLRIRALLLAHHTDPVGSTLLIGGLGTILAFEVKIVADKIMPLSSTYSGQLISCAVGLLCAVVFLMQEAFNDKLVAFGCRWTRKTRLMCWISFLALLIWVLPFGASEGDAYPFVLFGAIRLFSVAINLFSVTTTFGQILYEAGISKQMTLVWWLAMSIFILLVPLLDYLPVPPRR